MSADNSDRTGARRAERERRRRRSGDDDAPPRGVASLGENRYGHVEFDPKGNAIWQWRIEEPRRREDDPTIDELQCLTSEHLALADPDEPAAEGFNPYDKTGKRKP